MTDYSILSDQELQACAAAGDPDAEEALAERYVRSVRICARPLFLAGGDSEDLIQEGMLSNGTPLFNGRCFRRAADFTALYKRRLMHSSAYVLNGTFADGSYCRMADNSPSIPS